MPKPMLFTSPEAPLFWVVYLWAFVPEIRIVLQALKGGAGAQDAGTTRLIATINMVAQWAAVAASFLPWLVMSRPRAAFYAGTGLLIVGSLLRRYCFRLLGKYFTGAVIAKADQPVIERGPYRWIRHPSYTAGLIMFFGIGVALGHWVSVAILVLAPCCAYLRRVEVEERALLSSIGEPYRAYMARTKRFVPFVY